MRDSDHIHHFTIVAHEKGKYHKDSIVKAAVVSKQIQKRVRLATVKVLYVGQFDDASELEKFVAVDKDFWTYAFLSTKMLE